MLNIEHRQEFDARLEIIAKRSKSANGLALTISQSKFTLSRESSLLRDQEVLIPGFVKLTVQSLIAFFVGKLVKNLSHLSVCFSHPSKKVVNIELHHGARKNVATLRTVKTLINNLIIGVTRGFKYKMRYVYAHFPINVNIDNNSETGLYEVEIRYVENFYDFQGSQRGEPKQNKRLTRWLGFRNFIGEKIVRRVVMHPGVDVEISKNQKDELILTGNSLENVSQSAADIQQICRVRNKDIRKVGLFFLTTYQILGVTHG